MNSRTAPILRRLVSMLFTSQSRSPISLSTITTPTSHPHTQLPSRLSPKSPKSLTFQSSRTFSSQLTQQQRIQQQQSIDLCKKLRSTSLKQHSRHSQPHRSFSTTPQQQPTDPQALPVISAPQSTTIATSTTSATSATSNPNAIAKLDDRLVQITSASSARIKSKFPKGKVIFATLAIFGSYFFLQKKIREKSVEQFGSQYINTIDVSQIQSLQGIASLSREDIMHVFQWIQTEMTGNGMFETETISAQLHDEINDGRDDRKLDKQRIAGLYQVFQFDSQIQFMKDELVELIPKLNTLHNQLQLTFPGIEFNPETNDIINPQQYSSKLTPLEDLLAPGDAKRKSIFSEIEQISQEQKEVFLRSDISPADRTSTLTRLQEQIEILQHDLDVIKQEQLLLRSQYQSHVTTLSPEQQLIADYQNLKKLFDRKNHEIEVFLGGMQKEMDKLSPETQEQVQRFRQEVQSGIQPTATTEEIFNNNYYSIDNDEYRTNPWTWLLFFRNQPTGVAGDNRFIKYSDSLIALATLAKTKWNPADPHHARYISPQILRQYGLDVQKAFTDYTTDPLCLGGELTLAPFDHTTNQLNLAVSSLSEIKAPELGLFDRFKSALGLDIRPAMKAYQTELDSFNHYRQLHSQEINSQLPPEAQQRSVRYDQIYDKPLEQRLQVLGQLFKRANPNCQWDSVPESVKAQIADRFEFIRRRKAAQFTDKYDTNPKQPLSLAWASQFPSEPIQDTPHARNQYRRALGDCKQQFDLINKAFATTDSTRLSRGQFDKLIKSMANAGHFNVKNALLTRTHWVWPIQYHSTPHQVIAQAYYDCLGKSVDEDISLEEFDRAARYWGKVGKYDLWYYDPSMQGEDIPGFEVRKLQFQELLPRLMYSLGFGDHFCRSHRNPEGPLCNYVELSNRYTKQLVDETPTFIQQHFAPKTPLTLSQFSAHSKNISERNIFAPPEKSTDAAVGTVTLPSPPEATQLSPEDLPTSPQPDSPEHNVESGEKKSKKKKRAKKDKDVAKTADTTSPITPTIEPSSATPSHQPSTIALANETATTAAV